MSRYVISPERSLLRIDARSNVHPIHSQTEGLQGFIELDLTADGGVELEREPAGELSFSVVGLSSGNRLEDRELHKRIDSGRYPTIVAVMETMTSSATAGRYHVRGVVTFRGVSRTHEGLLNIARVDDRTVRLDGTSRFDIREFGMQPPRLLIARVEPEVDIGVDIVAAQADGG
jgi:YceI-like domain